MSVEVTARHMEATAALQEYAQRKGQGLLEDFRLVEHVHVILDVQKHLHIAEFVVQSKNRGHTESKESASSMKVAIDTAVDKVERQLRRVGEKVRDHKPAMRHTESEKERSL